MQTVMLQYTKENGDTLYEPVTRAQLYKYLKEEDWKFREEDGHLFIDTLESNLSFDITEMH